MKKASIILLSILTLTVLMITSNCTKTVTITQTEYLTDTMEVEIQPAWAIRANWYFPEENGETDFSTVCCWAIMRNISNLQDQSVDIENPRIGIFILNDDRKWKNFEKGLTSNDYVVVKEINQYQEIDCLSPGENAYMFFSTSIPQNVEARCYFIGLSGDQTMAKLAKPPADYTPTDGLTKPLTLEQIEEIETEMKIQYSDIHFDESMK